ncbi:MAG: hypothetical protein WB566_16390 [Terriglobales bacterium]
MSDSVQNDLLAEETHTGRAWVPVLLLVTIGPAAALLLTRTAAGIWPAVLGGLVGLGACVMAWSGFQYRFTRDGVEIRMLGFRLRSIPKQSILSYAIERWAFIRGYGIRGIGRMRAYVWCNKVVHIRTSNGDIYLGHNDPDRIARDLDMVTGVLTRG